MSEPNTTIIVQEEEMREPLTLEQRLVALEKELVESKKREAEKDAKIEEQGAKLEQMWKFVMEGQRNTSSAAEEEHNLTEVVEEKTEFVRHWKCDSYNNSYNSMYTKFTSNPHSSFMKQELKDEWMATNPRNKGQWEITLKRLVEYEFLEEGRDGRFKTFKLCEDVTRTAQELFEEIGENANSAGTARLA